MFTWIFKPILAGLLGLAVAGCGGPAFYGGGDTSRANTGTAASRIAVAGDAVVLEGPRGFCVDPSSTRASETVPFVVMGNCAVISGDGSVPQPAVPAVLTATVAPMDEGQVFDTQDGTLDAYFRSENGQRALSRENDAATVQVLDSFSEDDVFFLRASDTSAGPAQDLQAQHWRAYFEVNRRIVSATVLGFEGKTLASEQGLDVLRDFTRRIRAESDGGSKSPPVPVVKPASDGLRGIGLFRRLLG